jgi:hypothetical protein
MRKSVIIAVFFLFVFISCKKNYTCECIAPAGSIVLSNESFQLNGYKKDNADEKCKNRNMLYEYVGGTCELKQK